MEVRSGSWHGRHEPEGGRQRSEEALNREEGDGLRRSGSWRGLGDASNTRQRGGARQGSRAALIGALLVADVVESYRVGYSWVSVETGRCTEERLKGKEEDDLRRSWRTHSQLC